MAMEKLHIHKEKIPSDKKGKNYFEKHVTPIQLFLLLFLNATGNFKLLKIETKQFCLIEL